MALISPSPTIPQEKGTSAKQNTAVGSGSRPTASKFKIKTTNDYGTPSVRKGNTAPLK